MENHRCWVEVDGRALRHNFRILCGLIPRATRFMAVVKANAYGHGLIALSRELEIIGADWLGVANVAEGAALREAGVTLPILLLSATLPEEMEEAIRHGLTLTISSYSEAKRLSRVARELGEPAELHFKADTGMGRLGCWYPQAAAELARIRRLSGLVVRGLCTHFVSADDDAQLTKAQWKAVAPLFAANRDLLCHAANSPAVTRRYGFHANLIRAGLALYGTAPNPADQSLGLESVLTWKSRISFVRSIGAGRTVSYGATYRLPARQRHAVVAMGYGDGYFRLHSNLGDMLVRGRRCPIRGRVTMDQIIIDVSKVSGCRVGDEVVALGRQGRGEITARELAAQAQTIPWEILTNVGARVPRVYRNFRG
ncbi:MAG TPA: alanine racemase [Candidatus Methylacidiphilales bacterium]|nr:alanine racemase [Candidatus Methylacidiphilales bacterium]